MPTYVARKGKSSGVSRGRSATPELHASFAHPALSGELYCGDALPFLGSISTGSVGLLFLDPPFNLGKRYGTDQNLDRRPDSQYEEWFRAVLDESARCLQEGGALYLYHIPKWAIRFAYHLQQALSFRHWIAIAMKNGFVRGNRLYPAHYSLLYFTKGDPTVFRRPKLQPRRCRVCESELKDYGGYSPIIQRKGINLSDFWDDLSPVRHRGRKHRAANELPPLLSERIVEISGERGALFVDPFAGGGSAVLSAASAGMRFRACDLQRDNCSLITRRLKALHAVMESGSR